MILKKKIFFLILFSLLNLNSAKADLKEKLITKIKQTETIYFDFEQKISEKTETGTCIIKYQKLIKCDYNDKFQKRLISNGKTLAIIQKRYKKIFYYKLASTPLEYILDKNFLVKILKSKPLNNFNNELSFISYKEKNRNFEIFFNKKKLIITGWNTTDIYNNKVQFKIQNAVLNKKIDNKNFKIPSADDLK